MKSLFIILSILSVSASARDLHCQGTGKSKALKSFVIQKFFGKAHSTELDAYLLDGREILPSHVEYFLTNECDNGFTFKFPHREWRRLALGLRRTITAKVEYAYPGMMGEADTMEGEDTVFCTVRR